MAVEPHAQAQIHQQALCHSASMPRMLLYVVGD